MRTLALLVVGFALSAQSRPAAPSPTQSSRGDRRTSDDRGNGKGSETAAKVSQNAPNQEANGTRQNGPNRVEATPSESSASGINDVLVTVFTGALAILAGLQFWAMHRQARYMRDGLVETKKAADAAAKSVEVARESTEFSKRALEISERAYLSLGIPVIDFTANEIGIDIENSGRIPASDFAAEIEQVWFTVTFKEGTPRTEGWRHPVFRVAWGDTPISQSSGLKFRVPSSKVRVTVDKIKSPASDFFMVTVKGTYSTVLA